jgi:hypothetical protein
MLDLPHDLPDAARLRRRDETLLVEQRGAVSWYEE